MSQRFERHLCFKDFLDFKNLLECCIYFIDVLFFEEFHIIRRCFETLAFLKIFRGL